MHRLLLRSAPLLAHLSDELRSRIGKPFDEALAMDIYRTGMEFELKVFSEAQS